MIDRKTSFFTGIILVLVFIIILMRACTPGAKPCSTEPEVIVKTDTLYKDIVKTEVKSVVKYKTDTQYVKEPWMVPDTNYAVLKQQYEHLVDLYMAKNIYTDVIKLDSLGEITITDTVQHNNLLLRKYDHHYKIPTITKTIEVPRPPRRQLYIGGAIGATYPVSISSVQAGMLFKNKKDQIFGLSVGLDTRGVMTYSLSSYWKISFKR